MIRPLCRQFVLLCRRLDPFAKVLAAFNASKFKPANAGDRNYTAAVIQRRMEQVDRHSPVTWRPSILPIGRSPDSRDGAGSEAYAG